MRKKSRRWKAISKEKKREKIERECRRVLSDGVREEIMSGKDDEKESKDREMRVDEKI